jgi:hypothetical protein
MVALLEMPEVRHLVAERPHLRRPDTRDMVASMGVRIQAAYLEGAIPHLREHEPELWARLSALDEDDSPAALAAYERLFFEGLMRYAAALASRAA